MYHWSTRTNLLDSRFLFAEMASKFNSLLMRTFSRETSLHFAGELDRDFCRVKSELALTQSHLPTVQILRIREELVINLSAYNMPFLSSSFINLP